LLQFGAFIHFPTGIRSSSQPSDLDQFATGVQAAITAIRSGFDPSYSSFFNSVAINLFDTYPTPPRPVCTTCAPVVQLLSLDD